MCLNSYMNKLGDQMYWRGVVEDVMDPLEQGRVRVRIFGVHNEDKSLVPTDALPWAEISMPLTSASISGVGSAPVGLVEGSRVSGIFKDDGMQEPLIWFSHPGRAAVNINSSFGFNDPNGVYPKTDENAGHDVHYLARGINSKAASTAAGFAIANSGAATVESATVDEFAPKPDPNPELAKDAPWMTFANGERGVNEKDNASRVREYHKVGNGVAHSEDVAWCAGYVGWCLVQAGYKSSRSAMARSYSNYGKAIDGKIPYGAIVVLRGTRGPSSGHVCFALEDLGNKVKVIGGNQSSDEGKKYDNGGMVSVVNFSKDKIVSVTFPTTNEKKS